LGGQRICVDAGKAVEWLDLSRLIHAVCSALNYHGVLVVSEVGHALKNRLGHNLSIVEVALNVLLTGFTPHLIRFPSRLILAVEHRFHSEHYG